MVFPPGLEQTHSKKILVQPTNHLRCYMLDDLQCNGTRGCQVLCLIAPFLE